MSASIETDERVIVWFDIDDTLYSRSSKISQAIGERIHAYFVGLGLNHEEASKLHLSYYTQYGLAIRGLTRHHNIDPIEFDRQCDGSLPLEDMIKFDPAVRKLFEDIDRTKARVWALTNAYRTHAQRVLRILNLEDQVEGLLYCDYEAPDFVCKPEPEFYQLAMKQANVTDPSKCYFIDDNRANVDAARMQGWGRCVHFSEGGSAVARTGAQDSNVEVVTNLEQLRVVWPEIFKN